MRRAKHPKKEVEQALQYAEMQGWRVEPGGSHAWGRMYCPYNRRECRRGRDCIASVWSTPRDAGNHARLLHRVVRNCVFREPLEAEQHQEESPWNMSSM